jgi:predicted phage terminase large subunit-like protein
LYLKPNPGAQTNFLRSRADIVIYGGARGGGKSWALLLDALRYVDNPKFTSVIFRRTFPQVDAQGGLWDKSVELYSWLPAKPNKSSYRWNFQTGCSIGFAHLKDEQHKYNWQGAEICYLGYDELTHFTKSQFTFLFASNRSTCGVKPYIRATCNPDFTSWVRSLVDPWISEDGYVIPELCGKIKYFILDGDSFSFVDSSYITEDGLRAKSITYISADVWDNPALLKANPDYLTSLRSLPFLERERFLGIRGRGGNWNIKAESGTVFKSEWFNYVPLVSYQPGDKAVAFWDFAATTNTSSDYTVRCLMIKRGGKFYLVDIKRVKLPPAAADKLVRSQAEIDGINVGIRWQNDPGSAGVRDSANLMGLLSSFDARPVTEMRDKVSRALPVSAAFESGNLLICSGAWNQILVAELESFPDGQHDDQVDAVSGAYNYLSAIASRTGSYRY